MADSIVSSSKITAVANAIRAKAGTQSTMTLDEMPTAIANIPSGGGNTPLAGYDGRSWNAAVVSHIDTTGMTDMSYMFYYQQNVTSLDVSNFDTSNVTTMDDMFYECRQLTTLNLGNWNTSALTSTIDMFAYCTRLSTIYNFSNLNTSNVQYMQRMFQGFAQQLTPHPSLDLSHFRTSNVQYMQNMFSLSVLSSLDLDNWDTSNALSMQNMFSQSFTYGGKVWVPSTFVATAVTSNSNKPFYRAPSGPVHVYTDATDAETQGWGTIASNFIMHYNTTHQDFLNA